jgi:trans-2,3-dihydro-3-hydroxyanthranilate isomerase
VSATVTRCVAFADGPGGGNPCPVVRGAEDWSDAQMQAAAAAFGHETAFVLAPREAGAVVRLRYFVPRHEMEMCVHATVAASVLLGLEDGAGVETPLGVRRVARDGAHVLVEQFAPTFGPVVEDVAALAAALRIDAGALGPAQPVSTSRAKLMVSLGDEAAVDALAPDVDALWTLCDDLKVTGLYAFTVPAAGGVDAAARQFPVRAGYDEDPATGVAACALGAYLARDAADGLHRFAVAQGRAMGRPSRIAVEVVAEGGSVVATAVGGGAEVLGAPEALERPA